MRKIPVVDTITAARKMLVSTKRGRYGCARSAALNSGPKPVGAAVFSVKLVSVPDGEFCAENCITSTLS